MKRSLFLFFFIFSLAALHSVKAQDFVYQPKNPAFGGDTFNYQWLIQSASEQNRLKDPDEEDPFARDPLKEFEENLNRQILNQIARRILTTQFGEEGLEEGQYVFGSYIIDIFNDNTGVNINIQDASSGNSTSVVVPYY